MRGSRSGGADCCCSREGCDVCSPEGARNNGLRWEGRSVGRRGVRRVRDLKGGWWLASGWETGWGGGKGGGGGVPCGC